jgi:hypothetical protein
MQVPIQIDVREIDRLKLLTHHRSVNDERSDSPLSNFILPATWFHSSRDADYHTTLSVRIVTVSIPEQGVSIPSNMST